MAPVESQSRNGNMAIGSNAGARPRVLVVDDNVAFFESLVDALTQKGVSVEGCGPERLWEWCKKDDFRFDLVFLDMRLGLSNSGQVLNAAKVLPRLQTYSRQARVVVFSQEDISAAESVRCLELGALAVIPKTLCVDDLVTLVSVFGSIRDRGEASERLLQILWQSIAGKANDIGKGELFEMFAVNLFNSIDGFRVIGQNVRTIAGEIDLIVENVNAHPFWAALQSVQILVECKNRAEKQELTVLNQLKELVEGRRALSRTGVLLTISEPTSGLRARQQQFLSSHGLYLFVLSKLELQTLVDLAPADREPFLRTTFAKQ